MNGYTDIEVICLIILCSFGPIVLGLQVLRRKFPKKVNCWFCNGNTKVPYNERNSFICPSCNQYNGFAKDGGYNKFIPEQHDEMLNRQPPSTNRYITTPSNGLCKICNNNQQLKVIQLANFVPLNEDNYDVEIEHFQKQLEKAYKLCPKCDRVVRKEICKQSRWMLGIKLSYLKNTGKMLHNLNDSFGISKKRYFSNIIRSGIIITAVLLICTSVFYIYKEYKFIDSLYIPLIDIITKQYDSIAYEYYEQYAKHLLPRLNLTFKEILVLIVLQIFNISTLLIFGPFYKHPKPIVKQSREKFTQIRPNHRISDNYFREFQSSHNSTDKCSDSTDSGYENFKGKSNLNKTFVSPSKTIPIFGERALFGNALNKSKSPISFQELNTSFNSVNSTSTLLSFNGNMSNGFNVSNDISTSLSNLTINSGLEGRPILSPSKFKNPWGLRNWDKKFEGISRSSSQSSGIFSNCPDNLNSSSNSRANSICGELEYSVFSEPVCNKGFYPISRNNNGYHMNKFLHNSFNDTKSQYKAFSDTRSVYSNPNTSLYNFRQPSSDNFKRPLSINPSILTLTDQHQWKY